MMQFLMSRLQASAISWSSFSACINSRGLPTETTRVNRNGANERESSTKGSTKSLGMLAQTFGKPAVSTAPRCQNAFARLFGRTRENIAAGTNVSRKSVRWDWRLEAHLNRKANGLALEEPFCGTLRTFVGI